MSHLATARPTRALRALTVLVALALVVLVISVTPISSAGAVEPGGADPVGVWPLSPTPEVVHGFDPPDSPYGAGHRGVDLAGQAGQTVRTALAGTVTYAGLLAGRGIVVVDHGTTRTTYQPVAASVHVGEVVARGAPIGRLELGGSHCFPRACLHWGWIADPDTYLDPLRLVGVGPVRLLPLWRDRPAPTSPRVVLPFAGWQPLLRLLRLVSWA